MARAVALAPYLAAHARAALGLFATAGKTEGAAVLKAWLEAHPRRAFTQRDAHQGCRRHFDGPDEVADALDVLEAYGYVQDAPGQVPPARGPRGAPEAPGAADQPPLAARPPRPTRPARSTGNAELGRAASAGRGHRRGF